MSDYIDIDLNFGVNIKNDIAKKLDENAVFQSLKNIVMIRHKLFYPQFGANVEKYLFSTADQLALNNLKDIIELSIKEHEPRITEIYIDIKSDLDNHLLVINLYYKIKGSNTNYNNVMFLKFLK